MITVASQSYNIPYLMEQGHRLLAEQQFKAAKAYFDQILEKDPTNADAYWGLMLVARQCKSTQELYTRLAVPIGESSNFIRAMETASAEQKAAFQKTEQLVLLACHKKVLLNLLEGNDFFTEKWIDHYCNAKANNKIFLAEHAYISECLRTKKNVNMQKILLSVYEKYNSLPDLDDKEYVESLKHLVRQAYSTRMNRLLEDICKNANSISTDQLVAWADPISAVADSLNVSSTTIDLGLDGHPATAAERYIALATKLREKHFTTQAYKKIDFCYERALQIKNEPAYISHREDFYQKTVMRQGVSTDEINFIIDRAPGIGQYYWQYVLVATNNLTKRLPSYQEDASVTAFLQKNKYSYGQDEISSQLRAQEIARDTATDEYNTLLTSLERYVKNAVMHSEPTEQQQISALWEQYREKTNTDYSNNIAAIENRIAIITEKNRKDSFAGKRAAKIKGFALTLASLLLLTLSLAVYHAIAYTIEDAKEVIKYPLLNVYLIALAGISIVSVLQICITNWFCKYSPKKFKIPAFFRGIVRTANVIAKLLPIVTVAFLLYSAFTFPKNVGTISIKCAEDLQYIKNAPSCTFSLDADIDMSHGPAFYVWHFSGVLEGNGHTLRNLRPKDTHLIGTNSGTIQNLNLQDITASNALINKNTGTLENLSLKAINVSVKKDKAPNNTALFVNKNTKKGKISLCSISESNFSFAFSKKLSGRSCSVGGFVSTNDGSVAGCSISAVIQGEATFVNKNKYLYFGALAAKSSEIYGCSASGEITLKLTDKMNAGEFSDPDFHLQSGGLLGEGEVYRSSFNGNLTVAYSVDTAKRRTMDMDQEYNIGGLVGQGKANNSYTSGKLNITVENTNNDVVGRIARIGSLVGYAKGSPWVENCYTNMTSKLELDGSDYDGISMVGGAYSAYKDVVLNSFVYPPKKITVQKTTRMNRGSIRDIPFNNCYCASGYNYDTHWSLDECKDISAGKLLTEEFILETLGWDPEIWNVKQGKLPTLKPYPALEATE